MKERSRVKKTLKFILCIALLLLQNDFNVLAEVNETETEIVDENSYQKINLNEIDKMKNAAMGQNQEMTSRDFRDVGPYWVNENGIKSFYDANNVLFERKGTKKIINVSEHNGKIDWKKVKSSDVDGVIIRVGYGHLMEDKYFQYNVSECNRLGIPYGIYLYSYAYDANFAYEEANGTDEMLK